MSVEKVLMGAGTALFAVMAVLMKVGTTSLGLFVTYGVLAMAGAGAAAAGKKMRDQSRSR
ncbi:hypothetical protein ACKI1I_01295 [Streptomyces turgidiscabies]|uniref:Uncharacterized protein n=1 Tax=Streptomyces turgidiscabies (strain Car8) TaxID=698760 RepID=L7ETE0_STRT8|nr:MULTISPECIES: hypothetical protein [Streptomyces]ELP62678.1 hypothetical protein STRTUCAR8_05206 [Streptomyces turgidiscabies Car8]MDX3492466.1 hypothetical protein [Streptomyces turgidiscabies]GAQ69240.1 hypothetical protein T45_00962 [Streptomyces turgidiscabies]